MNEIAVRSASGIIAIATNRQNMLTVPHNERRACERQLSVFSKCNRPVLHASSARTTTEMSPRTKIVCPAGMSRPRYLMHTSMPAKTTTEASFSVMPRTGKWREEAGTGAIVANGLRCNPASFANP